MPENKSLILFPTRCGPSGATVILITVALYAGFSIVLHFLGGPETEVKLYQGSYALLLVLALIFRNPMAVHVTLFTFLNMVWFWTNIWPSFWPFFPLIPLVFYAAIVAVIPSLRKTIGWLRLGKFGWSEGWLIFLTVIISSSALLLWFFLLKPDLSRFLNAFPSWNPVLLAPIGLGFALVNATIEESIYRGILMQVLDVALGAGNLSVMLQALTFGFHHIRGFPDGWIGVGMATIYGLMLGLIRRRAKGILAPFVTHVFADVVIFCILVFWVR